ncbi:hypothetical protein E6P09_09485 [Haloferax mediterranei ATCC 33500]|uniref:Uncharacterized protein n=1 Tax=Haloferax mediterranei (strain ATCC 33500 / DSM 1411 / JCM 8866 / NBRC 14739 / NCIMB 2177 / R-4) TaxID=523841 RepID=M0J365_HALMT|nr:hypothetical protein [Haloferax mediterranei]AHZ21636.1 hypothetical protein BM92_02720 [Haloferax mediterranei ATCC 33500]EMA03552.1 hypothetical protein C439_04035 [Haloferax mediterranei ATCC 33500]MDX5989100.1 hypothetical protein [Haloferax mediterranei ATCC 33500]QCQ75486.1 hypothetical protein E6P09_09485 [Haloferax mediterranei ATCC 33500]
MSGKLLGAIKHVSKPVAVLTVVVSITLGVSWFSTSPPRHVWFHQETVTVTRTVNPWWMAGVDVLPILVIILVTWVMMSIGPRRIH